MYRLREAVWYESYFQFFDANKWAAVTFFSFHGFLLVIFFYTRNQYIINVIWIRKLWQTYRPQKWFYLDLLAISWCCQRMNERTNDSDNSSAFEHRHQFIFTTCMHSRLRWIHIYVLGECVCVYFHLTGAVPLATNNENKMCLKIYTDFKSLYLREHENLFARRLLTWMLNVWPVPCYSGQ